MQSKKNFPEGRRVNKAYGINLNENDLIILRFTLDNSASSQIEKKAIVRSVKKNYAGCEFFGVDDYDRTIKFYLL